MTRHTAYVVVLEEPIREDDAARIRVALQSIRGVTAVEPVPSDALAEGAATIRTRVDIANKLSDFIGAEVLR